MISGRLICLCLTLLLSPACASKPGRELTEAQKSVESAKNAQADLYSAEIYRAAEARLEEAQAEIAAQERKSSFSRDFNRARQLLAQAKKEAGRALATAAGNRERTRAEARLAEAKAQAAVESARNAISSPGTSVKGDLNLLREDLKATEISFEQAQSAYRDGRFMDAMNQFLAAREKAEVLMSDLRPAGGGRR